MDVPVTQEDRRPGGQARRLLAALPLLGLGLTAPALAHADAAASAPGTAGDVELLKPAASVVYLNGGAGRPEAEAMRRDAAHWPLRIAFQGAPGPVAGVHLAMADARGHTLLRLAHGGPMTFVMLAAGDYRVTASYHGHAQTREVRVGPEGQDLDFRWTP